MPQAAARVCPRCQRSSQICECPKHNWNNKRFKSRKDSLYHSHKWRKVRNKRLALDHYLCVPHKSRGMIEPATQVDHIKSAAVIGIDAFEASFYDIDSLQSICDACHKAKTQEESRISKG